MAGISGKRGRVTVGGAAINCSEAEVSDEAPEVDTCTFEDGGQGSRDVGPEDLSWSFKGMWTIGGGPPGIYPRSDLQALSITPTTLGAKAAVMPLACVLSSTCSLAAKGNAVMFGAAGKSQPGFTRLIT